MNPMDATIQQGWAKIAWTKGIRILKQLKIAL